MMEFKPFSSQVYRLALMTSTALIAAVMVAPQAARADITITSPTAATQSLSAGETLTVTNTGTISASPAALINGVAATAVNNSGTIDGGGGIGIYVRTFGDLSTGIDNTGLIKGNYGISLNSATITGGITNQAGGIVLSPSSAAVYISHSSVVTGALNNMGTLSGGSTGLLLTNNTVDIQGGVQNSGVISGGDAGIWVSSDADISGGITNTATGSISGNSDGIRLTNTTMTGSIINQAGGSIAGGTRGIAVRSGSDITGGIDNSGLIIGGMAGTDGGIDIFDNSNVSGGIINRATGIIKSNNDTAFGIYNGTSMTGLIDNQGLISALGSAGVYIGNFGGTASSAAGGLNNSGRIIGVSTGIILHKGDIGTGGLVNSGTVSGANVAGILLQSTGNISGGIHNSGLIKGANGIRVDVGSNISGGVTNAAAGIISGAATGIILANTNAKISGSVNNSGTIVGGTNAGLKAAGAGNDIAGGVTNSGSIIGGAQAGIWLRSGGKISGVVNNSGLIKGTTGAGIWLFNNGDMSAGIQNTGSIIGGTSSGIRLKSGTGLAGGIANNAGGTIAGADVGIDFDNEIVTGSITNAAGATISGVTRGISIGGNSDIQGGLVNNGSIIGGTKTAIRLTYTGADITGGVTNGGLIKGAKAFFDNGAAKGISGGLTNNAGGTIEGTSGTAIDLPSLTVSTPININGGRIIGDVRDGNTAGGFSPVTIGGDFKTEGDFTVSSVKMSAGKTLEISSGNTFAVNHMDASGAGSGINFMVTNSGAGGFGQFIVNGAGQAVNLANITIGVDVAATPTLANGDKLLVADGVASVLNGPGATAQTLIDNSAVWDFQLIDGSTVGGDVSQLYLLVSAGTCSDVTIGGAASLTQNMCGGETLTITATGKLAAAPAVNVGAGIAAKLIDNSGTIDGGTQSAIVVTGAGANLTTGIINQATGVINAAGVDGIHIISGANVTGGIQNMGTISAHSTGVYLKTSTLAGDITNSGLIKGNIRGIETVNATVSGKIANSTGGTISGALYAILVSNNSDIQGGIDNSGLIKGNTESSIGVTGAGSNLTAGIINRAGGVITSTSADGIHIASNANVTGAIQNMGTISASSSGIYIKSSTLAGTITNSGLINVGRNGIRAVLGSTLSSSIVNSAGGTISGDTQALFVQSGAKIQGGVTNSGLMKGNTKGGIWVEGAGSDIGTTITNTSTGTISSGKYAAINIHSGATLTGQIVNQGLIIGTNATSATGIFVGYANADIAGGIVNTGTIKSAISGVQSWSNGDISGGVANNVGGLISGGSVGVLVHSADISGGVDNKGIVKGVLAGFGIQNGNISGLVNNEAGGTISGVATAIGVSNGDISGGINNSGVITGAKGIYTKSASKISGGITNNAGGTITGTGGTAIDLQALSALTPLNINGGRIIGDVTDSAPASGFSAVTIGGTFKTEGDFTVSSMAVSAGQRLEISSGNTFTVDHMNASGAGSGIVFMVTNSGAGGFGQLVVNGAGQAVDLTNITVTVDVAATPTLAAGDQLLVADGLGNVAVTAQTVTDNSAAWNFQLVDGTNGGVVGGDITQYYLLVSAAAPPVTFTPITQGNANAQTTLNGLGGTADPQLAQIVTNLGAATTNAGYNNVLSSVQPDVSGASFQASLNVLDSSLDLVENWLNGISQKWESTGLSSGNAAGNDLQGWAQAFGNYATQDKRNNIAGYDAHTAGFAMGVDTGSRYENGKVGVAVSYAQTATSSDNSNRSENGIKSYQVTAYGELKLSERSFVRGMAAYVRGDTHTTRYDVGGVPGLTAKGDFASNQYTARVMAGHGYMFGHKGTFTPHVLANWTHYNAQDYTETGAGGANLTVSQKAVDMAELGLGADINWHFQQPSGAVFTPQLHAGYRYDFIGDRLETTAGFAGGGAAFTSPGPVPSRSRFNMGAQLGWQSAGNWSALLGYDFDYRDGYYAHSGVFRLSDKF